MHLVSIDTLEEIGYYEVGYLEFVLIIKQIVFLRALNFWKTVFSRCSEVFSNWHTIYNAYFWAIVLFFYYLSFN